MSVDSWLCLGGTEIVNACRAGVYASNGFRPLGVDINPCGCCGTAAQWAAAMDEAAYSNPTADEAPWYAASEPHSGDFGGFIATSITGLGAGPITRSLTGRANGRGSFIGQAVQTAPVITVTGILFGKTCCSVDYGKRWLSTVLQGSCGSDCDGDTLTFLDCCPDFDACDNEFDCLTPNLRYLEGVQLIQSPTITRRFGACCGNCKGNAYVEVTFQLAADPACVFRDPVNITTNQPFDAEDPDDCDITWVPVPDGGTCPEETDCAAVGDCLTGDCGDLPSPPKAPPPENPCICYSFNTRRAVATIPAGSIPEFTEGLPVLRIYSGPKPLRQVRVRFFLANQGQTIDQVDPCQACGEVTLSQIPESSTFTFDGKGRKATILCPGAGTTEIDATPLMGSAGGRLPIEWPEIQCAGSRFLMSVEADAESVSPEAAISLDIVPTECFSAEGGS